jgi:hypothetical protein
LSFLEVILQANAGKYPKTEDDRLLQHPTQFIFNEVPDIVFCRPKYKLCERKCVEHDLLWDVGLLILVKNDKRFRRSYYLHHQGDE